MLRYGLMLAAMVLVAAPMSAEAQVAERTFAVTYLSSDGVFEGQIIFLEDTSGPLAGEEGDVAMKIGPDLGDANGTYEADEPVDGVTAFSVTAKSDDDYFISYDGTVTESARPRGAARISARGIATSGAIFFIFGKEI